MVVGGDLDRVVHAPRAQHACQPLRRNQTPVTADALQKRPSLVWCNSWSDRAISTIRHSAEVSSAPGRCSQFRTGTIIGTPRRGSRPAFPETGLPSVRVRCPLRPEWSQGVPLRRPSATSSGRYRTAPPVSGRVGFTPRGGFSRLRAYQALARISLPSVRCSAACVDWLRAVEHRDSGGVTGDSRRSMT